MENTVVKLNFPIPEIAVIQLEDRVYKNMFSEAINSGLRTVTNKIKGDANAKVIVIHGYENYFCCGGTKTELINILEGRLSFLDLDFYRMLLDFEMPTIAAMQGHAIGGGLTFGCYADLIVMAEESIYSANFMKYGFTPGAGATYIIPRKMGDSLGCEMLMSARNYHGSELKARGASVLVVPKRAVISEAMALAHELAQKPVVSLKLLKKRMVAKIRSELPEVIKEELAMHQISFDQPEVRNLIDKLYAPLQRTPAESNRM